ncbi:MAG: class I SAM-dependent methyltransferase [Oscillospiraceae bacterium]|nr:class I SAM-dependent methyltransferase [Oscillospiraceae bacterium]
MFWNRIAGFYDFFEALYNKQVYANTGKVAAEFIRKTDNVLECACGTGAISVWIAGACNTLVATDYAENMLRKAKKKCDGFPNLRFEQADIMKLNYQDQAFDKVVAGNVIHLLKEPQKALAELERVTKPGGQMIIPTYINMTKKSNRATIKLLELLGADFNRQFDLASYKAFFASLGYQSVAYRVVDGKMPCAIAIINKT